MATYSKIKVVKKNLQVSLKKSGGVQELVIKKKNIKGYLGITRLADVLEELPNGLVHKDETGMGATTLELLTPRNSIIVEPIKITASSKAYTHTISSGTKVLYVGSETKYHTKKITKAQIINYLNDDTIKYKKIVVVADSLSRGVDAGKDVILKDYALLIDEADSFQIDSTFRSSMEGCIDLYKKFDAKKRCLVSATMLDFSDPDLNTEPKTIIKYDVPSKRKIDVIASASGIFLLGIALEKITALIKSYPDDKIMIAYNSVKGCYSLAELLVTAGNIKQEEVKILCSRNSKDKVSNYYAELESDKLPSKINFVTSAYFTGFDLNEHMHLVSISGTKSPIHSLSDSRLKQIAGRCRLGLLSETIIHDSIEKKDIQQPALKAEILSAAKTELDAMQCMQKHYNKIPLLKSFYNIISDQILKTLEDNQRRFIRRVGGFFDYEMAYLNIDAFIESSNTRYYVYKKLDTLTELLKKQGHQVKVNFKMSSTVVVLKDIDKVDKVDKVNQVIKILKNHSPTFDDLFEIKKSNRLNSLQISILENFVALRSYISNENLIKVLQSTASKKDSRQYDNLILSINFLILPEGDLYKSRMKKYFPIGIALKPAEIANRLKIVFIESGMVKTIDSEVSAVRYLKTHFKCKRQRKDAKYIIGSENPFGLKILKTKDEFENIKTLKQIVDLFSKTT